MGNSISRTRERVETNTRRVLRRLRRSSSREDLRPETLLPQLSVPESPIPPTLRFVFHRTEYFYDVGHENSSVRRIRLPIRVPPPVCPRWSGSVLTMSDGLDFPFPPPPPDVFLDEGSLLPPPRLPRRPTNPPPPPPVPPRRSSPHQPSDQPISPLQQQNAIDDEELSDEMSDEESFYEPSDGTLSEMSSSEWSDEENVVSNEVTWNQLNDQMP
ncbi:unnamed protein product [Caenorhabditis nigoni]